LQEYASDDFRAMVTAFSHCPSDYVDWILDLTVRNMHEIYDEAWPWSESVKEFELKERGSNYLIAAAPNPIAFVHFRFEEQNNEMVLFIYDIQVESDAQNRGLGSFLVAACEFIARERKATCVMTMLFKANEIGIRFFRRLSFTAHPVSPEVLNPAKAEEFKHIILWKQIGSRA
jgi:ribosomal protein S18 acetylase RimI-like enzyme